MEKETEQAKSSKIDTALSIGATFMGMFMGRKKLSHSTLGRASTSFRRAGKIKKEMRDVDVAKEKLDVLLENFKELEAKLQEEIKDIQQQTDPATEVFETLSIKPKKMNTSVPLMTLGWLPYVETSIGRMEPAWREKD